MIKIRNSVLKAGIVVLGEIIFAIVLIGQYKFGIIDNHTSEVLFLLLGFLAIYYIYMKRYQVKDNDENAEKNKLMMLFFTMVEIITMLGFFAEYSYDAYNGPVVSVRITYTVTIISAIIYVVNSIMFFIKENSRLFKYILLIEFTFIYITAAIIANNWVFFITLPMIAICTIYGETKFLVISGIIQNLATIYSCVSKIKLMPEKDNPGYFSAIYITIVCVHIAFTICIIATSKMIGKINQNKRKEMLQKQENMKELSREVLSIGKEIKEMAYSTSDIIEQLEQTTSESLKIYSIISQGNEVNTSSAKEQENMTLSINDMIHNVDVEVARALNTTKHSKLGVEKGNKSVDKLKEKSNTVIEHNKEVILAFEELMQNIKNIKSIVGGIFEISEQTNLLSVNAYIESAKSGVHHKSFDVVASEIGGLSDATRDLTVDMHNIVINLEGSTFRAKNVIEDIMKQVDDENKIIDLTVMGFHKMDYNITGLAESVNTISDKVGMVIEHSKKIGDQSSRIAALSDMIESNTKDAVNMNVENQKKTIKTKEAMDELVGVVETLNEYI